MADLGEIWSEHARDARRLCVALVGREQADDALGRVSLAAQSSLARGGEVVSPRSWLLAIARNVCADIHRERMRAAVECLPDDALELAASRAAVSLDYGNPERRYLARERMRRARSLFDSLPHELRESFLALTEGRSSCETLARAAGVTPAAFRKRIERARTLLRRRLTEEERACPTRRH
jgi:RNA polymerase sigma-70 factor, ECF subfamily